MSDFKAFLRINNFKQAEAAEYFDVSQSFISQVANNIRPIPDEFLLKTKNDDNIKGLNFLTDKNNISSLGTDYTNISKNSKGRSNELDADHDLNLSINAYEVPSFPISAIGGTLSGFYLQIMDTNHEKIISPIKNADFAITVSGDSMSPEFPSGAKILIKKINEKAFIDWGRTYVLDTINGIVIKNIYPSDDKDPSKLKCVSINPEYPPFEVSFADIFGVYRVMLCMSIK